ncbi:hypothetical protein LI177_00345 [bacterium 210820-DFI.6.37]|nr:hypothetical protein [bacterium 210820-DFI.6.37]
MSKSLTAEQQEMINQVAATMAIENMPVTKQAYENMRAYLTGEKTKKEILDDIKVRYTNAR